MLSTPHVGYGLVLSVCGLPGICSGPWATGSAAPEHMALALELVAALRDSAFMEHAARAQLLLSQLVPPMAQCSEGGGDLGGLTPGQRQLCIITVLCRTSIVELTALAEKMAVGPAQLAPPPGAKDARPPGATAASSALQQILFGRCMHTARLCFGVAALCVADGGPAYGLPPPLLAAVAPLTDMGDRDTVEGCAGAGGGGGEAAGDGAGSRGLVSCVRLASTMLPYKRTQPAPPGKRVACALALRIGRLALASLPPVPGPTAAEAEATLRAEADGAVAAGGCGRGRSADSSARGGSGCGGSNVADGASAPTDTLTRPRRVMPFAEAARTCCTALGAARLQLQRRGGARDSATWRADAAECWRLATAAARHALPCAGEDVLTELADDFMWLWWETVRAAPNPAKQPLYDEPPPLVAAALDAGVLPCLERLLRRAARAPDGPEAAFCGRTFGCAHRDQYVLMSMLLAYGDPRQATALVATLDKVARTTDPRVATAAWAPKQDSRQCLLSLPSLVPALTTSLSTLAVMCVGSDAALATAEGCSGSGDVTLAAWLSLLLEELGAVELLGAVLELLAAGDRESLAPPQPLLTAEAGQYQADQEGPEEGPEAAPEDGPEDGVTGDWDMTWLANACGAVATVLRMADAAAGPFVSVSRRNTRGGLASPPQPPPWRPELLQKVAGRLRAAGAEDSGAGAQELAAILNAWGSPCEGPLGRDGPGGVEGGAAAGGGEAKDAQPVGSIEGTPLPYPAEARRLLRTCANPDCANLEGDSEADLALWECSSAAGPAGGSGAAELCCCRSCKSLGWLAGHGGRQEEL
ncbi:hypothetical protein GPECTOR_1g25 [Gonium pectorale]|uniref:Uncharacterized protein n=1 Tax=Gonium pectorale TaxID=33097 RepID=A0A150H2M4_GONPE|nr:hypothetical protein GPECTOR_1g25 [Gonium pectorale]|eukprot:KXZ56285.1 hypothetical protein GPECTOR_1g25 [Gonium pectorale]